jgi:hypothetical protein
VLAEVAVVDRPQERRARRLGDHGECHRLRVDVGIDAPVVLTGPDRVCDVPVDPRRALRDARGQARTLPRAAQLDGEHMGGARLEAHYPLSAIFHGLGLNVTVVSYGDRVDWGIAGDPEQISDAWGRLISVSGVVENATVRRPDIRPVERVFGASTVASSSAGARGGSSE